MIKISSLLGNNQRLDGGAMFGHVPKALWSKWLTADDNNCVTLACRALLIEEDNKRILLETGIGAFFSPELKKRYGVYPEHHVLLDSLQNLHFDHAGGLLAAYQENSNNSLLFPNARYLVSLEAFTRAKAPHMRDKASFIPELTSLLEGSKRMELITSEYSPTLGANYKFHFSHGHTPGLILTEINTAEGPLVFAADLIPGVAWLHTPITMGYDRYPEKVVDEKKALLDYLVAKKGRLFYTHDPKTALSNIVRDDKGCFMASSMLDEVTRHEF
ncbi:MAG: fold hydrolase [Gammaproteobacteria bacterium]|nr:fold hydrolase [Gammaproteobacteria bacterium]